MPSTELVGPVRRVLIGNDRGEWDPTRGRVRLPWRLPVVAPRHTLEPEAQTCRNHHPACACFMAEVMEEQAESRWERSETERVFREVLDGHRTWDERGNPDCMCTGCVIARELPFPLFAVLWAARRDEVVRQNTARLQVWQAQRRAGLPYTDGVEVPF